MAAQIIKPREVYLDQIAQRCEKECNTEKLQEQLMDLAEILNSIVDDEVMDDASLAAERQRVLDLGMKNALLAERKDNVVAAVKAVRLATATGSHRIDPNEDDATVPNFHNLINSEYVARAPKSSSSSSSASSSSSSSSSSSLSSASSKATAYPLDDEDTARFEGDEDIQNMRKELGLKAEAEMDEDDDVMEGEEDESLENLTRKLTCVITQQVMEMPMVSKLCNHTFEKAGILNMINKSPAKACKCPIGGCNKMISKADLEVNKGYVRKLKKLAKLVEKARKEEQNTQLSEDEDMLGI